MPRIGSCSRKRESGPTQVSSESELNQRRAYRLTSDNDTGHCVGVVVDEGLSSSLEVGHLRVLLDTGLVDQIVIENNLAVYGRLSEQV